MQPVLLVTRGGRARDQPSSVRRVASMARVSASPDHMASLTRLLALEQEEVVKQMLDVGPIQPCTSQLGAVRAQEGWYLRICYNGLSDNVVQQAAISASFLCACVFSYEASFWEGAMGLPCCCCNASGSNTC
jgi:hypothetical protein